jgi:hypothetical protein
VEVNKLKLTMKLTKLFIAGMFALALLAAPAFAGESCCDKAKAKGEECKHKCCVDAKKDGKTCEKCNGKKDEGKHKGEEKK